METSTSTSSENAGSPHGRSRETDIAGLSKATRLLSIVCSVGGRDIGNRLLEDVRNLCSVARVSSRELDLKPRVEEADWLVGELIANAFESIRDVAKWHYRKRRYLYLHKRWMHYALKLGCRRESVPKY